MITLTATRSPFDKVLAIFSDIEVDVYTAWIKCGAGRHPILKTPALLPT